MIITIIIFGAICLFTYLYTNKLKNENKIIQNLEIYAKEEKIKQQESKILGQKSSKQNRRSKKARVYNS